MRRGRKTSRPDGRPAILLLRLERVGDLLMTLDAIGAVRRLAPDAAIDLVVGEWNEAIARLIPGIDRVETLSAGWLARGADGLSFPALARRAWGWRRRGYDLAINFEGDIRSNVLLGLSGARRRVGFGMAGGGPMLTDCVAFDPAIHTRSSALRLVERAFDLADGSQEGSRPRPGTARLSIPGEARARAASLLSGIAGTGPVVVRARWRRARDQAVESRSVRRRRQPPLRRP